MNDIRCGTGFDAHAFVEGRRLIIGGVEIKFHLGLAGHSDADILIHAIIDALLGAAGLGDIGFHYPDRDMAYKDISSIILLETTRDKVAEVGWKISNIDATVVAQVPRLADYIDEMREHLAGTLKIDKGRVNIKATTTERMGFTGREEGMAAIAAATLYK
jgi:2-C-methyl-D-erythritol 2,4-cyclodiphosphate synthase